MDDKKVNMPDAAVQPEEPLADAMSYATSAQKEREAEEAELRRAQQELKLQKQEQERARQAATAQQAGSVLQTESAGRNRFEDDEPESRREKKKKKTSLKKQDKIKRRRKKKYCGRGRPVLWPGVEAPGGVPEAVRGNTFV